MRGRVINFLVLLYTAAVWALAFIFLKVEESTIPPITIMAGRALTAFVFLLAAALITKKDLMGHFRYFGTFLIFAILGMTFLSLGMAFGQEYISVGLASVMVTFVPLVTFVILVFILGEERFSFIGLAGLLIGAVGIALVIGTQNISEDWSTVKGSLLVAGAFVCFGINGVLADKWAKGIDPIITTTYILGLASIILWTLAFIFESPLKAPWTPNNFLEELGLGVISTASGYFAYYFIINRAGAYFSSLIFYFIPVFGVLSGYLILHETVTLTQIVGVAVIIAGVYLINREKAKG